MSNSKRTIEYPLNAILSFYKTSACYYLRAEHILKDFFQEKVSFSKEQKESLYDTLLTSRVICITVEDLNLLDLPEDTDVVSLDIVTAKMLSGLLASLSDYLDRSKKMGIDILSTH
tara:strand:+ start:74 stop:421 length:348 start_codon:yes stop_codon:yes gene_type:complete